MPIASLAMDKHGRAIQVLKSGTNQNVLTTSAGSVATTNATAGDCIVVRVVVTTDSYVVFGSSPTANNASMVMTAGVPEYFRVDQGGIKVAARAITTDGILSVTEMI
jgi:hypothetical protein